MKRIYILGIYLLLVYSYGCQNSAKKQEQMEKRDIRHAVQKAFSLEQQLWEHKSEYKTRKQVYLHYRQGFSDELAESLTSYSWSDGELRATERTMETPDTVHILSYSDKRATVYYIIPFDLRNIWQLKKYSIAYLRKEGNRWIIYESKESDTIPTPVHG